MYQTEINKKTSVMLLMIVLLIGATGSSAVVANNGLSVKTEAEIPGFTPSSMNSRHRRALRREATRRERRAIRRTGPRSMLRRWMSMPSSMREGLVAAHRRQAIIKQAAFLILGLLATALLGPLASAPFVLGAVSEDTGWWTFPKRLQPGMKKVNPQSSREFLRLGPVHSLTGDPLQNSLDARDDKTKPVVFEVGIFDGDYSIPKEDAIRFFGPELERHLKSGMVDGDEISVTERIATFDEDMTYVTLEDFNTVGLLGRVDQFDIPNQSMTTEQKDELNANRCLWYFRSQNATTADQDRRGSWGEGKFTLEAASRLGAQISWSVRKAATTTKQILMGQTTLLWHSLRKQGIEVDPATGLKITEGIDKFGKVHYDDYAPFGMFSTTSPGEKEGMDYAPLPLNDDENPTQLEAFAEMFRMRRKDQNGLSILIPHPHEEILDQDALARSFIARWLLTIHRGDLVVNIRHNGELIHSISRETVRDLVGDMNWNIEPKKVGSRSEINPAYRTEEQWNALLDLLDWAEKPDSEHCFDCSETGAYGMPTWVNPFSNYEDEEQADLRAKFESGEKLRITARPWIHPKGESPVLGRLDITMMKAESNLHTQIFARDGMTIPFVSGSENGVIAVVHCPLVGDEKNLHALLRHAEGPAHLEWNTGAHRIVPSGNKWERGKSTVTYVNDSVKHLMGWMSKPAENVTHPLPLFTFTVPGPEDEVIVVGPDNTPEPGVGPTGPVIPPIPQPSSDFCRIPSSQKNGKVTIRKGSLDITGDIIEVNLAYDRHRGDPWKKHRLFDFDVGQITHITTGATFLSESSKPSTNKGHVMTFEITDADWKIVLSGFGSDRDIAVEATRAVV